MLTSNIVTNCDCILMTAFMQVCMDKHVYVSVNFSFWCLYQFLCSNDFLQWVNRLMSQLAPLIACHFIAELCLCCTVLCSMANEIWYGMVVCNYVLIRCCILLLMSRFICCISPECKLFEEVR